jgi:outer membrane lipoprotein-sorting protein
VWWTVLAGAEPPGISIRRDKDRRYVLRAAGSAETGAASATLTLDRRGLPSTLELDEAGERSTYQFSSWTFTAPHGRKAFVLEAPPGFEVVPMP